VFCAQLSYAANEVLGECSWKARRRLKRTSGVWIGRAVSGYLDELKGSKKRSCCFPHAQAGGTAKRLRWISRRCCADREKSSSSASALVKDHTLRYAGCHSSESRCQSIPTAPGISRRTVRRHARSLAGCQEPDRCTRTSVKISITLPDMKRANTKLISPPPELCSNGFVNPEIRDGRAEGSGADVSEGLN